MNEQIKRRLKELEVKYPSIDDFSMLSVTFHDGSKKQMLLKELVQYESDEIESIDSNNPDLKALACALMWIDIGLDADS